MNLAFRISANISVFLMMLALASAKLQAQPLRTNIVLSPELASEALDPALMCVAIYHNAGVLGWRGPKDNLGEMPLRDIDSGFHAGIYEQNENGRRRLFLTFRGTDTFSAADWKTNLMQALGLETTPYQLARIRAQELKAYCGKNSATAALTGHSLGGGMAAYGGICWKLRTYAFASAPLGSKTQDDIRQINPVGFQTAPLYVTHFFIAGDKVPATSQFLGDHFGGIIHPEMDPPDNLSGVESNQEHMALLALAGMDTGKLIDRGITIREVVDALARHSADNYVEALVAHANHSINGIDMMGAWRSKGSFFQISSAETNFNLTANNRMEMHNRLLFLGEYKITDTIDTGRWWYENGRMAIQIPHLATFYYEMISHEGNKAVQWKRVDATVDDAGFMQASKLRGNAQSASGALLVLKGVCEMMKGKVVTWFHTDEKIF